MKDEPIKLNDTTDCNLCGQDDVRDVITINGEDFFLCPKCDFPKGMTHDDV